MANRKEETDLQTNIRLALSKAGCTIFRANVGLFYTKDGRLVRTGLPKGFSDTFGTIDGTGQSFYIEIKTPVGKASKEQKQFIAQMQLIGAKAGFARTVEDALNIVGRK